MSDKLTLQELVEVQKHFALPSPALVKKDWYIIKAVAAMTAIAVSPFRLIFSGGTALARAYKLVQRMPEDVDCKVVMAMPNALSQSARHKRLSQLRKRVTEALLGAGFHFDPTNINQLRVRDSSQYTIYHLPYEANVS